MGKYPLILGHGLRYVSRLWVIIRYLTTFKDDASLKHSRCVWHCRQKRLSTFKYSLAKNIIRYLLLLYSKVSYLHQQVVADWDTSNPDKMSSVIFIDTFKQHFLSELHSHQRHVADLQWPAWKSVNRFKAKVDHCRMSTARGLRKQGNRTGFSGLDVKLTNRQSYWKNYDINRDWINRESRDYRPTDRSIMLTRTKSTLFRKHRAQLKHEL